MVNYYSCSMFLHHFVGINFLSHTRSIASFMLRSASEVSIYANKFLAWSTLTTHARTMLEKQTWLGNSNMFFFIFLGWKWQRLFSLGCKVRWTRQICHQEITNKLGIATRKHGDALGNNKWIKKTRNGPVNQYWGMNVGGHRHILL